MTCGISAHVSDTEAVRRKEPLHHAERQLPSDEACTVTVHQDLVHDVDTDDSGPDTDTLPADFIWSFTVATGTAPPFPPTCI